MKAAARIIEGQCGRELVWLVKGRLEVCRGCACSPPFCTCHAVGLYAGLGTILEDIRREP